MFGTIRRHQKWLWGVIITLTILSFVIYFSPTQRLANAPTRSNEPIGSVGGRPVMREEVDAVLREVLMSVLCNYGSLEMAQQPGFDLERRTYVRLLLIEKAKEYGLQTGDEAAKQMAGNVLNGFRRQGVNSYRDLVDGVFRRHNLSSTDFEQFVRHELAIRQLIALHGLAGSLVTPQEAEEIYRQENEEIDGQAIFFPATNYLASVKVTPEALVQFYTNRLANYKIGERAVLDYVSFPSSNYFADAETQMAAMTNLTEIINATYLQRGAEAYPDAKTPEEAKAKIREQLRGELSLVTAHRAANAFLNNVLAGGSNRLDLLKQGAAASNQMVRTTEPFVIEQGPKEFPTPAEFSRVVTNLPTEEPISSSPLVSSNAVYLIALDRRIPSEIPTLDSIRDRVTEDFKRSEALVAAHIAGAGAERAVKAALAAGKDFAEACTNAKVTPVKLPPFSLRSRTEPEIEKHVNLGVLENVAFRTAPGQTSEFVDPTEEGGFILHVDRRLPVNPEKMKAGLPEFVNYLRQTRENEALNAWLNKQQQSGYMVINRREPENQPPRGANGGSR